MNSIRKTPLKVATYLIACSAGLCSLDSYASDLDLRLSNSAVHTNFTFDRSRSKAKFGLGYFYKDDKYSVNLVNVDLHVKGQSVIGNLPATIGLGFEGNMYKFGDFKGSAVGLGGSLRLNIPSVPGLSVETNLHYAPDVLSYGDADEFRRFRTQANYRIIENADVSLGYRYINAGLEETSKNVNLESGVYLGLKLNL